MSGTALVTGASSGIGAAVVRALTKAGYRVHAVARRADRLETLAVETDCLPLVADVRDTAALERMVPDLCPDILINNAGLGAGLTGLARASGEDVARTIDTNVTALLQLCRVVIPGMTERGRGHIVNLGSVAGLYPINSAVYGGSKGAVHLISQNLRLELRGSGVRVTEINPGRVTTEFFDVAVPDPVPGIDKSPPIRALTAEDVAAAILYAVQAPLHVNVSMVELQPTEQSFGGGGFDPVEWGTR